MYPVGNQYYIIWHSSSFFEKKKRNMGKVFFNNWEFYIIIFFFFTLYSHFSISTDFYPSMRWFYVWKETQYDTFVKSRLPNRSAWGKWRCGCWASGNLLLTIHTHMPSGSQHFPGAHTPTRRLLLHTTASFVPCILCHYSSSILSSFISPRQLKYGHKVSLLSVSSGKNRHLIKASWSNEPE